MSEAHYQQFLIDNPYPRRLQQHELIPGHAPAVRLKRNGRELINFSSSDYLGLSTHPELIARSQEYAKQYGVGAGASRLVSGNFSLYEEIESRLATALGKPTALILGTGYQTNLSVLEALCHKKVLGTEPLIFCDKHCHVSMQIAGQSVGKLQRFHHNDLAHLQTLLEKNKHSYQPRFILVESFYSMDGDAADLPALIALAKEYGAFLYVDDAHAVGMYGHNGFGKAVDYTQDIPFIMGTFSKACGSFGAYIGCSKITREYLINRCKGLIYSTGLSPMILGAISAAIELLPQLTVERQQVLKQADQLRNFLKNQQLNVGNSTGHIVPWIIGDSKRTLHMATLLEERGILAVAIQPPSVQHSLIRFCVTAKHSDADLEQLMIAIKKIIDLSL